MVKVGITVGSTKNIKAHNLFLITNSLFDLGHKVYLLNIDTLVLNNNSLFSNCYEVKKKLKLGDTLLTDENIEINSLNIIWILTISKSSTFLDKIQLLNLVSYKVKFINSLKSIFFYRNKYTPISIPKIETPITYASNNFKELWKIFLTQKGNWVLKPPSLSRSKGLFFVNNKDINAKTIFESCFNKNEPNYYILQQQIDTVNEKRVLMVAGKPVCSFLKAKKRKTCRLNEQEIEFCNILGNFLLENDIYFSGIDMSYPYLIEINLFDSGGIEMLYEIDGKDISKSVIKLIFNKLKI